MYKTESWTRNTVPQRPSAGLQPPSPRIRGEGQAVPPVEHETDHAGAATHDTLCREGAGRFVAASASEAESSRRSQRELEVPGGPHCIWLTFRAAALGVRCSHWDRPSTFTSVHLLEKMLKPCQKVPDSAISARVSGRILLSACRFGIIRSDLKTALSAIKRPRCTGPAESAMTNSQRCSLYFRVGKRRQIGPGSKRGSGIRVIRALMSGRHRLALG